MIYFCLYTTKRKDCIQRIMDEFTGEVEEIYKIIKPLTDEQVEMLEKNENLQKVKRKKPGRKRTKPQKTEGKEKHILTPARKRALEKARVSKREKQKQSKIAGERSSMEREQEKREVSQPKQTEPMKQPEPQTFQTPTLNW